MIYTIIGIIIIILVLILLSFLLIPLKFSLDLKKNGSEIKGHFILKFLGIRIFSKEIPGDEKGQDDKEEDKKEGKKDEFDLKRILKILKLVKNSWPHLYRLIIVFYHSVNLEKFSLNMTLGMESPADTALFTGYIWSFTYPLNAITRIHAVITPDFQRRVLDGDLQVDVTLKLFWIVAEAIRAYTKKPVRELIQEARS
ncbi:hypothetical protein BK008_09175 [Methanobacterium sp. MZ-A1]|uniref:DUF2953 domain-containing protein n=1 Tax=Methanobacterium subterraneum TaxID=59277 RepID=A0A2H4VEV3_9EURY|nr:hypothetical protein BK007_11730 [Methanobacterium subterraneum]AUB58466.1 hypothetical protein BK008_09175 [Methanobacterium sp. MZ-A1]MBW4257194.1 DUF2953 domain-containing protein [Methanobacterium sp. YSL]NMO09602.1 DUF2953 domain-containing protein [Methanobacterium subterraneum]PKL71619.1 MAG: hypothetical protein CVV29_09680 [Methanobacteriales archaeon HGW-Methanobacteriales-2]